MAVDIGWRYLLGCIEDRLSAYADEMSWREDNRRKSTGELYLAIVDAALKHGVSRQWKGYWQRGVIS